MSFSAGVPAPHDATWVLRAAGRRLHQLARVATSPQRPRNYLELLDPVRFGSGLRGRIVGRHQETARAVTLSIRPGPRWAGHIPGQYVHLGVDVAGVRRWRTYTLTSAPSDRLLKVTVQQTAGGMVSGFLTDPAAVGSLVHLEQAEGDFVTSARRAGPTHLFVSAGSGITPVMAILRHQPAVRAASVVLHSAPTPEDVIYGSELRDWDGAGGFRLIERHTSSEGRWSPDELDDLVPDWRDRQAWVCGPGELVDAAVGCWQAAGLADRLHLERFTLPAPAPVDDATPAGPVTFTASGAQGTGRPGATLLALGEEAGVEMPAGCRTGVCFRCASELQQGTVRDLRTGECTTAARGDGVFVQTCVTTPVGPIDVKR